MGLALKILPSSSAGSAHLPLGGSGTVLLLPGLLEVGSSSSEEEERLLVVAKAASAAGTSPTDLAEVRLKYPQSRKTGRRCRAPAMVIPPPEEKSNTGHLFSPLTSSSHRQYPSNFLTDFNNKGCGYEEYCHFHFITLKAC